MTSVIKPRLETVAMLFPSARTIADEKSSRARCWSAHSDRYPVTAKIEFAVEHDESIERVFVRYDCSFMPAFVRFQPHDKLTFQLNDVAVNKMAVWVEDRVLEFLDTYLGYDRGQDDLEKDLVTDPVCGMHLRRSEAVGQSDYKGHGYFFCSSDCLQKFKVKPEAFVTAGTM